MQPCASSPSTSMPPTMPQSFSRESSCAIYAGGSFGWSGAFGTHFWVDRKQKLIAIAMTQTSNQEFLRDFENMVMQAVVGGGTGRGATN